MSRKTNILSTAGQAATNLYQRTNLTELQLLYWVGQQLRPDTPQFNNVLAFTFPTALDPELFSQAFSHVVNASDALRTVICDREGVPMQTVLPQPPAQLHLHDFTTIVANPEKSATNWMAERARKPLNISSALYDAALLQLASDKSVWYLNQHHLITDATSIFLVYEHTLAAYDALLANGRFPVLSLPSFNKHLQTKAKFRGSRRHDRALTFWHNLLADDVPPLEFYGRIKTAPNASPQVKRHKLILSPAESNALRQKALASAASGTAPDLAYFNTLAAITFALLHTTTGQKRLGLITTIHNRPTPAARKIIGPVMELAPLLVTVTSDDTFQMLIDRVQETMRQVLIHYRYGTGQALHNQAFVVMLNLNQRPSLTHDGQPVEQAIIHPQSGAERLALHAHYLEATDNYEIYVDFNEDIFPPALQNHALQQLRTILDNFLADSPHPLTAVALPWPDQAVQTTKAQSPRPAYVPPKTSMEHKLQTIWEDVLDIRPVSIQDDFFALGGESWQAMSLFLEIEKVTGHYLPIANLLQAGTIAAQAALLGHENNRCAPIPEAPDGLILIRRGKPNKRPLFYIPGAAGNTLIANRLAKYLSPDLPIYACQMPGTGKEETPQTTVEGLAAIYRQAIQRAQPHGPYQIIGFSAGGVAAFEVAQQLTRAGETVTPLISIDISIQGPGFRFWWRLSQLTARWRGLDQAAAEELYLTIRDRIFELNYNWRYRLTGLIMPQIANQLKNFWRMTNRERWQKIQDKRRRQQSSTIDEPRRVIPTEEWETVTDPHLRRLGETNDRAMRLYIASRYPGDMVNIRCSRRHGRATLRSHDYDLGWRRVVQNVETIVLPAPGHMKLVHEPHVKTLGQLIQEKIDAHLTTNGQQPTPKQKETI